MNTKLIKALVKLVKSEEQNRERARKSMPPDAAYNQAIFHDTPLTNELYLLVLLFVWHDIEKEIVLLAALSAVRNPSPITRDDYGKEVRRLEGLGQDKRRKELEQLLPKIDTRAWDFLDTLRLLANSFKHDPFDKPKAILLKRLGLPGNMNYASLSESGAVRFGLGRVLAIGDDAEFSEIVDAVYKSCDRLLFLLRAATPLRSFEYERVSMNPDTFEH